MIHDYQRWEDDRQEQEGQRDIESFTQTIPRLGWASHFPECWKAQPEDLSPPASGRRAVKEPNP